MVVNFRECFLKLIVIISTLIPGMRFDQTDDDVCWGPECDKLGQEILANMIPTENPCVDFYEYACGNWKNNHPLPSGKRAHSIIDLMMKEIYRKLSGLLSMKILDSDSNLIKKSKQLYKACMNTRKIKMDAIHRLRAKMDIAGGWPMIYPPDKFDQSMHWEGMHYYFAKITGEGALFNINVNQHYRDKTRNGIFIDQPYGLFGIPGRITDPIYISKYKTLLKEIAKKFVEDAGTNIPDQDIEKDIQDVIQFRFVLQQSLNFGSTRNVPSYTDFTIEGLQQATPQAADDTQVNTDWLRLIQGTFTLIKNAGITKDTEIILREQNYILGAPHRILITPRRVLANHIYMYFVEKHFKYLPDPIATLVDNFFTAITGQPRPHKERWHECVTSHPMQHALSSLYITWYFPQSERSKVNDILRDVKQTMRGRINNANWLEAATKQEALLKVDNLKTIIGSPEWYRHSDSQELEDYYKGQKVGSNYIQNILDYEEYEYKTELGFYTGESTKLPDDEYPIQPNAYFEKTNKMVINVGQTLPPFYHYKFPPVVNYAGLGTVIGHEMTHGFDRTGRKYDHNGQRNSWWTPNSLTEFSNRLRCFINQYSNYGYKELQNTHPGLRVDGVRTLSENLADTVGLQVAYEAYKEKMKQPLPRKRVSTLRHIDNEQVFFLIYANTYCEYQEPSILLERIQVDTHTTGRLRVNGPLSNMPEFSQAFNCGPNTPMNPSTQCFFW